MALRITRRLRDIRADNRKMICEMSYTQAKPTFTKVGPLPPYWVSTQGKS